MRVRTRMLRSRSKKSGLYTVRSSMERTRPSMKYGKPQAPYEMRSPFSRTTISSDASRRRALDAAASPAATPPHHHKPHSTAPAARLPRTNSRMSKTLGSDRSGKQLFTAETSSS